MDISEKRRATSDPLDSLIEQARGGDEDARGRLLEKYRNYLKLLAGIQIGRRLRGKVDASDLVQESFLEAHRDFGQLRGQTEAELVGWLRQILATNLANTIRRYLGTQQRDVRLEQELGADLERSSRQFDEGLVARGSSPSAQAARHERAVLLANALAEMNERQRTVIVLRHLEELSFSEVALRMGQSVESVKKLWARALIRLRGLIGESA